MIKTGGSYYPLRVCLQFVCFDGSMRTVRDTQRMGTSNGPKKDLFAYPRKVAVTPRCRIMP